MARRRNSSGGVGTLVFGGILYALPTIYLILYHAALLYGVLILLLLAFYSFYGASKLRNNQASFRQVHLDYSNLQTELANFQASTANLSVTQSGRFDERSYRGKAANIEASRLAGDIASAIDDLNGMLSYYKSAIFYRTAALSYFISVAGFVFLQLDAKNIPIAAAGVSFVTGSLIRSFVKSAIQRQSLPQLNPNVSYAILAICLVGATFTYVEFVEPQNPFQNIFESKGVASSGAAKEETSDVVEPFKAESKIELISPPIATPPVSDAKKGFLLRGSFARFSSGQENAASVMLPKGKEVTISSITADKKWYVVKVAGQADELLIAVEDVGIFSQ